MTLLEQIQEQVSKLPREKQQEVLDFASFLQSRQITEHGVDEERSERITSTLNRLAAMKTFGDIEDPVEWQRETRRDRPLPGRVQ